MVKLNTCLFKNVKHFPTFHSMHGMFSFFYDLRHEKMILFRLNTLIGAFIFRYGFWNADPQGNRSFHETVR